MLSINKLNNLVIQVYLNTYITRLFNFNFVLFINNNTIWLVCFQEYENQSTPEAKFAKDLDRYDMILQAFEYEKREKKPQKLQEFFTATEGKFNHPYIRELVDELYRQREEFEKKTLLNGHVQFQNTYQLIFLGSGGMRLLYAAALNCPKP